MWGIAKYSYYPIGNIDKRYVGGVNMDYTYDSDNTLAQISVVAGLVLAPL